MIMTLSVAGSVQSSMWLVVLVLIKTTAVLVVALLVARALRAAQAAVRHAVWLAALASLLLIPALTIWGPIGLPIMGASAAASATAGPSITSATGDAGLPAPDQSRAATTGARSSSPHRAANPLMISALLWLTGTVVLLLRLAIGLARVRRIARRATPLDTEEWKAALWECSDRAGVAQSVKLLLSDESPIAFACGFSEPTIVLPSGARLWTDTRRRAVLLHELAHLHRRDLIGHRLGLFLCAVYWYHPLVWMAARRMRAESEVACDDTVLACGVGRTDYAEDLLELVLQVTESPMPILAVLPLAQRSEFEGRLLHVLDVSTKRRSLGRATFVAGIAPLAGMGILFAAVVPVQTTRETSSVALRAPAQDSGDSMVGLLMNRPAKQTASRPFAQASIRQAPTETRGPVAGDAPGVPRPTSQEPTALEVMLSALRSAVDSNVRMTAAWSLVNRDDIPVGPAISDGLGRAVQTDLSAEVREMAAWALARAPATQVSNRALGAAAKDVHPAVRETAAWALGASGSTDAAIVLRSFLSDRDQRVRRTAAWSLGELADPIAASSLFSALAIEADTAARSAEVRAIAFMTARSPNVLAAALASTNMDLQRRASHTLAFGAAPVWPWPWPRPRPGPSSRLR